MSIDVSRVVPLRPAGSPGRSRRVRVAIALVIFGAAAPACQTDEPGTGVLANRLTGIPSPAEFVWSDSMAWPNRRLPQAQDVVIIPEGRRVVLDVDPPALGGLDVRGELVADTARDLQLHTPWIRVSGLFRIGQATAPYTRRARIILTGSPDDGGIAGMGTRVIAVVPGGRLDLHGPVHRTWTQLSSSTAAGATALELREAVEWRAGDWVVVAPSGFEPSEAEHRQIERVTGQTIHLATALLHPHFGELQTIAGQTVDERAEVALLTRNITVAGDGPELEGAPRSADGQGGHIMVMAGGAAYVQGVELVNMGRRGKQGQYPIHWHLSGRVAGQYIRHSSIWRSNNRCVTVHGTQELLVEQNVCFDHIGHGYFLEEGAETGNRIHGNLGLLSRQPNPADQLIPSDSRPATFWITNPDNSLIGNVAAGSEHFGFWYALPERPIGMSAGQPNRPSRTPLLAFRDNVAHSNHQTGLHVDDGPDDSGREVVTMYRPSDAAMDGSPLRPAVFEGFRAYKNRNRGVWLRGQMHFLNRPVLADNHIAATFASVESYLTEALVIGRTNNRIGADARQLYRGFEYYDGPVGARDVTFVGFTGSGDIPSSALGFNRHNAFSVSTASRSDDLRFLDSRELYLETPQPDRDGDKSAVFMDGSGSLTGTAGRWVVANTPFLTVPQCDTKPEWNAQNCPGPYLKLVVEGQSIPAELVPVDVRRDGVAEERFVGDGNSPSRVAMSVMPGHAYHLRLGRLPRGLSINLREGRDAEWILVSIETPTPPVHAGGIYGPLRLVANRESVMGGDGSTYAYDALQGLLHVKVVVARPESWNQGGVALQLRP